MSEVVGKIKARTNIVEYIQQSGVELKKMGGIYKGSCPFHEESTGSFAVYPDTQKFKCYGAGCGKYGDIVNYVHYREGFPEGEEGNKKAIQYLAQELGIETPKKKGGKIERITDRHLAKKIINDYLVKSLAKNQKVLDYLKKTRGLTDKEIKDWGIGCGTGTMYWDFNKRIDIKTLKKTGVVYKKEGETKYRDRIWNTMFTVPIYTDKGRLSHWWLRDIEVKDGPQIEKKFREKDVSSEFINIQDLKNNDRVVIVEGFFDCVYVKREGHNCVACDGAPTDGQIAYLQDQRDKAIVFEEISDANKNYILFGDRDKSESGYAGQHWVTQAARKLCRIHRVAIWILPEIGIDPNEYLSGGGQTKDLIEEIIYKKPLLIEEIDGGYYINDKKGAREITNFLMKPMYEFHHTDDSLSENIITREIAFLIGRKTEVFDVKMGDVASSKNNFNKFLMNKGWYHFKGTDQDLSELYDYIQYKDVSQSVLVSQDYGNIKENVWLFDNGCIKDGKIEYADKNNIVWGAIEGFSGAKTTTASNDNKATKRYCICKEEKMWTIPEIAKSALEYYPEWLVKMMLGYGVLCYCRDIITDKYMYFLLLLAFGQSTHGKTKFVKIIQSLFGAGRSELHSCSDSTKKSFMRDMSKYINLPQQLSEWTKKYISVLRNAFDLTLYKQARQTVGKETYAPRLGSPIIFTGELTPGEMSILNRCILLDFNKFKYEEKKRKLFDVWVGNMANDGYGIGFLKYLANSNIKDIVLEKIDIIYDDIEGLCPNVNSRTISLYGQIFGGFVALMDVCPDLEEAFPGNAGRAGEIKAASESADHIMKTHDLVESADILYTFFKYVHVLYVMYNDRYKKICNTESGVLFFHVDSMVSEVTAYDSRANRKLDGVHKHDIVARIFLQLENAKWDDSESIMHIPLDDLKREFNLDFMDIEGIDPELE